MKIIYKLIEIPIKKLIEILGFDVFLSYVFVIFLTIFTLTFFKGV